MDGWWAELGRPDPFVVVEVGAGDGQRAAQVLAEPLECRRALRYVLVEADPAARVAHHDRVPLEEPSEVLGPLAAASPDEEAVPDPGRGPLVASLAELPVTGTAGAVVAIGWLSSLATDRWEWRDGRWWEVRLAAGGPAGDRLVELAVPLDPEGAASASALVPEPGPDGARYPRFAAAAAWLRAAQESIAPGLVVVADRWTPVTVPVAAGEAPALAADQLPAAPWTGEAAGGDLSPLRALTWRS